MDKKRTLLRIAILEKEIADLKKEVNKEEIKNSRWIPEKGERYWFIETGAIASYENEKTPVDEDIINAHKIFRTEEEAFFELECQRMLRKMEEFEYHFTNEDWKNGGIEKYYLCFDVDLKQIVINYGYSLMRGIPYFKSQEDAEACISEIGEDNLKKYYFCI